MMQAGRRSKDGITLTSGSTLQPMETLVNGRNMAVSGDDILNPDILYPATNTHSHVLHLARLWR